MIGSGNAENVATEILNQFLDAIERSMNVDFPIFRQGFCQHSLNIEHAVIRIQFATLGGPKLRECKAETIAEFIGNQFDGKEKLARSRIPTVAGGEETAAPQEGQ